MERSYAVAWREENGPVYAGKLELGPAGLRLEGAARRGRRSLQKLFYDELAAARIGRNAADRIGGGPTLVLERRSGSRLLVRSVGGLGVVLELADRLAHALSGLPV